MGRKTYEAEKRVSAWALFVRAHRVLVSRLEGELQEEVGIRLSWLEVLTNIANQPEGRLRANDLATMVLFDKARLSRVMDRLSGAGLLRRQRSARDRRGVYAVITPEGRALAEQGQRVFVRSFREHFLSHVSDEDLTVFQRVLAQLAEGQREWSQEPLAAGVNEG